jgi:hypothetical protein
VDHALRDLEAPDHASGITLDQAIAGFGEPHSFKRRQDAGLAFAARDEIEARGEEQVLIARQRPVRREELRHVADVAPDRGGRADDVVPGDDGSP